MQTTCSQPWAVVVGKKEEFEVQDLLLMPVTIARIHGTWWSENYLVGYFLFSLILVPLVVAFRSKDLIRLTLLCGAGVVNIAFLIAKLINTVMFASDSPGAWVITFAELLPFILVVRLIREPGPRLAIFSCLVAVALLFLFGVGFYIGNVFLFFGALMTIFRS